MEIEEIVQNWEYWCPRCKNRTFGVVTETPNRLEESVRQGEVRHLTVRVLICTRCAAPTVLGTYAYHSPEKGWGARGSWQRAKPIMGTGNLVKPLEYVAFQEPVTERELPATVPKSVQSSFREAEFAVAHHKPIGAAAAIRNTIRLFVESEKITGDLKAAIKQLNIPPDYRAALGNPKIIGDHTLHFEEYEPTELSEALEVLYLVLVETYRSRERLQSLTKAVGDKASKRGKVENPTAA